MNDIIERHWRPFLIALACVALVSACFDLALREWMQAAASGLLLLGVLAFWRSLHYHSVRWRAVSGIALVLAMTMQFIRFVSA